MTVARSSALRSRGIVITRPLHQAGPLAAMVEAAGGRAILFPVIAIVEPASLAAFHAVVDRLQRFDLAVFISPNAAQRAMALIGARRTLPAGLAVAAIGGATAKALRALGVADMIVPGDSFDSEALLAHPALASMAGKRVVIFRGEGGRELLGDALTARGASVEYAECYRRVRPHLDAAPLLDAWAKGGVDAVVVTSSEGLDNFLETIGTRGAEHLAATPLFVTHPRIAGAAHARGLTRVTSTASGDDGVMAGLCRFFSESR